jgi:hypothetical protein
MENNKIQESSKIKSINMKNNFPNSMQEKIIRSKSKNMYPSKKIYKSKNSNKYPNPKPVLNNNKNIINNCQIEKPDPSYLKKDYLMKKNSQSDLRQNKLDLIELKKLNQENISLKETLIQQEHLLKELHDLFIHNYNKINSLRKKYSKYKHYLKYTIYGDSEEQLMKEKYEEEYALRAVEQQIMDEICPNPDKMSYEQLLQLEEEVGSVNKGLAKDKIKKIPVKPFHKALFDDNLDCIICMEKFEEGEQVKQLNCGHIFHGDCIDKWLEKEKKCPFCKSECN